MVACMRDPMPTALNPFVPGNERAYQSWRESKLDGYPERLEQLMVEVEDPLKLTAGERQAVLRRIRKCNMAIYVCSAGSEQNKGLVRVLGQQFGLQRLDHNLCADDDAISSLQTQPDALRQGYIPYTDRPIAWHTDGYYNDLEHQILGLVLHCVVPAARGGANQLLDHELVFMQLHDRNPEFTRALMHPTTMTIPANVVADRVVRPARTGPVFSILPGGQLHMRYTDRSRSIEWRDDALAREAVAELKKILNTPSPYRLAGTLQSGQGLICNNILHTRSAFENGETQRLLYRARYFDRIAGS
jgi:hypothetical protein